MTDDFLRQIVEKNSEHLGILNGEMGEVVIRLTSLEIKMDLVLGVMSVIGVALVGLFLATLWKAILIKKNGH